MRKEERKDLTNILWSLISAIQRIAEKTEIDLPELPNDEKAGEVGNVWHSLNNIEHDRY